MEFSGWHDVEPALISDAGLSREVASRLLERSARRIHNLLQSEATPLQLQDLRLKAEGFAGAIALSTTVELEVVPRCLSGDTAADSGRDDFLFIATLAKQGKLALRIHISASPRTAHSRGTPSKCLDPLLCTGGRGQHRAMPRRHPNCADRLGTVKGIPRVVAHWSAARWRKARLLARYHARSPVERDS